LRDIPLTDQSYAGFLVEMVERGQKASSLTTNVYNDDNELSSSTVAVSGGATTTITNSYDANGSLVYSASTTGGVTTTSTYTYALRNKMIDYAVNGTTEASYVYDDAGNRVQEAVTSDGTTTTSYYLIDSNNPTGYAKAIQQSTTLGGTPTLSYILGPSIVAQSSSAGVLYFLTDGHGSTRALINTGGQVATVGGVSQVFDYDAFGDALDFTPTAAATTWLFGGDGFYDPASGWTYQLARWRNGFWFTQQDPAGPFAPGDLADADLYVYVGGNPINLSDPTGDWAATLGTAVNNWLSRQFELPGGGAVPGSLRFGNRWVSTILRRTVGYAGPPIPLRPDAVEYYTNFLGMKEGDIYEFKPGPITMALNPGSLVSAAANAITQIASYATLLSIAPHVLWVPGVLLWPGVKAWPAFFNPQQPAGSTLEPLTK
jgi:RHS repeat-associated protein